jgi:hypothetical protein
MVMASPRYGLGRLAAPDPRDAQFPLALALSSTAPPIVTKIWDTGPILNQGDTPHCVGYAWRQFLYTDPPGDTDPVPSGDDIYALAQQCDEWAGTPHNGSSVRGGAAALAASAPILLTSYLWALSLDALTLWVTTHGPVVFGTQWYEAMFDPDADNVVAPGGSVVGGHAFLCIGFDAERQLFRFCNSWGTGWADGGKFWMTPESVTQLVFTEDGDACTAVEAVVQPLPAAGGGS